MRIQEGIVVDVFKEDLLSLGICDPVTKRTLSAAELEEKIQSGYVSLLPDNHALEKMGKKFRLWRQVQDQGEDSYYADGPEGNFSHENYQPGVALGNAIADALASVKAEKPHCALDVGCGMLGEPVYMQLNKSCKWVGIDPILGGDCEHYEPRRFPFVQALGDFLPFSDQTFDVVCLSSTLDHQINPQQSIAEAHRVLKPGGKLFVVETVREANWHYIKWLLKTTFSGASIYNRYHCYAFTLNSLKRVAKRFKVTDYRPLAQGEMLLVADKPAC